MNPSNAPAFPSGLSFNDARAIVSAVADARRPPAQARALGRAHGHVLAQDVVAPMALPPFDNSAMDGFALRHADLATDADSVLRLVGEQFAGHSLGLEIGPGQCLRITTGAPLPAGADAIAIKENVRVDGDRVVVPRECPVPARA